MLGLPPSVSVTKEDSYAPYEPAPGGPINPPIITHTAATPMATPQGSPNEATNNNKDLKNNLAVVRAYDMTSQSMHSIDKSSSVRLLALLLHVCVILTNIPDFIH